MRIVANRYRTVSLTAEIDAALSTLTSAGITAHLGAARTALPPAADIVLAIALREAVTNMLQHSTARWCLIEVDDAGDRARLHVANDGVRLSNSGQVVGGHGLESLGTRLEAVGGRFSAGTDEQGRFHMIAEAPVDGLARTAPVASCGLGGSTTTAGPEPPGHGRRFGQLSAPSRLSGVHRWAPLTALVITLVALCASMLVMVGHVLTEGRAASRLTGLATCCTVIVCLHTVHTREWVQR